MLSDSEVLVSIFAHFALNDQLNWAQLAAHRRTGTCAACRALEQWTDRK